jgi:hypothetical protein
MPIEPEQEAEVKERVEREFAALESVSEERRVGVLDVLQVYGGYEVALRQADAYLGLLNPTSETVSTTNTSNLRG